MTKTAMVRTVLAMALMGSVLIGCGDSKGGKQNADAQAAGGNAWADAAAAFSHLDAAAGAGGSAGSTGSAGSMATAGTTASGGTTGGARTTGGAGTSGATSLAGSTGGGSTGTQAQEGTTSSSAGSGGASGSGGATGGASTTSSSSGGGAGGSGFGGTTATGGAPSSTIGGSAGTSATGGAATGGSSSRGGTSTTGGALTGGSSSQGGTSNTGGVATGGSSQGGTTATGGVGGAGGTGPVSLSWDFTTNTEGWLGDFSDYPPNIGTGYDLKFQWSSLPTEVGPGGGLMMSGNNHSDDLFMYLKRHLTGLARKATYTLDVSVIIDSNAPETCGGIGGSPGLSVAFKIGAVPFEPLAALDAQEHLWLNLDKGNQSVGGADMKVVGNISNTLPCLNYTYQAKTLTLNGFTVTTADDGTLWLIMGTDSGFEGITTLYYDRISVTLTPKP